MGGLLGRQRPARHGRMNRVMSKIVDSLSGEMVEQAPGLTARQIELLEIAWDAATPRASAICLNFLQEIVRLYPSYRYETGCLSMYSLKICHFIDATIQDLETYGEIGEELQDQLRLVGRAMYCSRVKVEHLDTAPPFFTDNLRLGLGWMRKEGARVPSWTEEMRKAWVRSGQMVCFFVKIGYEVAYLEHLRIKYRV